MKKKRTILIAALIMVLTVTMALPGVGYAALTSSRRYI